ncbi:MAG: TolC family protein [Bacteroidales bacterium]|nr:TolC family protein [Bacteroidales bacterium]
MILFSSLVALALTLSPADTATYPTVITLRQAMEIALSENVSVKVADLEIERSEYAKRGTYASLFPQVDGSAAYQRTIKKQVMYMDFDMGSMFGGGDDTELPEGIEPPAPSGGNSGGIEVGRWNTWSAGINASMPLVNAQLWKSLAVSGQDVELAVEKARASRLEMITQVKSAFYGVLLAKEVYSVYEGVYDNAVRNFEQVRMKYNAQKASELDYVRAKTAVTSAIPDLYDADNAIALALWRLKAVMGVDLDMNLDVSGSLQDYSQQMFYDIHRHDGAPLDRNATMRQIAIQAEELANAVKMQQYASLPTLSLGFAYSLNAMTNDFKFSEYRWSPYSYVGLSLSIPIFAGGRRNYAIKQAKVQSRELELQRQDTERQLKISIRQQLNTMETAMNSLSAAKESVETAAKAYDIASKSYDVGRSTLTDLNAAQLALTQAQLSVSQAIYSFVTAQAQLEQILGIEEEEQ